DDERDDVVVFLVRRVKELSTRIEREEARPFAARWLAAEESETAAVLRHGEYRDAVMTSVRHVQEPPIRRDGNFGSGVPIGLAFRQCADDFHFLDPSVIPAIGRDRGIKFVIHVEHRQRWVKDAM